MSEARDTDEALGRCLRCRSYVAYELLTDEHVCAERRRCDRALAVAELVEEIVALKRSA